MYTMRILLVFLTCAQCIISIIIIIIKIILLKYFLEVLLPWTQQQEDEDTINNKQIQQQHCHWKQLLFTSSGEDGGEVATIQSLAVGGGAHFSGEP